MVLGPCWNLRHGSTHLGIGRQLPGLEPIFPAGRIAPRTRIAARDASCVMKNLKPRTQAARRWAAVAALGLGLAVAAAGTAQAAPRTVGAPLRPALVSPTLCSSFAQLDRLVVKRLDAFPQNHFHFSFPAVVTVSDPPLVQKAARAVCALPVMPRTSMNCPADLGITYRLTFYTAAQPFPRVVVSATGCESVTGLLFTRWVARTPAFWPELGKTMGLKNATWETFRGSGAG